MKSDVLCDISSCRLHTKPYKLVFLNWFVLANQAEWISISSVHYFQDGGQALLTYLLLLTYIWPPNLNNNIILLQSYKKCSVI